MSEHLLVVSSGVADGQRFTNRFDRPLQLSKTSTITFRQCSIPALPTILVDDSNSEITFREATGAPAVTAIIEEGEYDSMQALAAAIQLALNNAAVLVDATGRGTSHLVGLYHASTGGTRFSFLRFTSTPYPQSFPAAQQTNTAFANGFLSKTSQGPHWDAQAVSQHALGRGAARATFVMPGAGVLHPAQPNQVAISLGQPVLSPDTSADPFEPSKLAEAKAYVLLWTEGGAYRIATPLNPQPQGTDTPFPCTAGDAVRLEKSGLEYHFLVKPQTAANYTRIHSESWDLDGELASPQPLFMSVAFGACELQVAGGVVPGEATQDIAAHTPSSVDLEFPAGEVKDLPAGDLGAAVATSATYTWGGLRRELGFNSATTQTNQLSFTRVRAPRAPTGSGVTPALRIDCNLPLISRHGSTGRNGQTLAVVLQPDNNAKRITYTDPAPVPLALNYASPTSVNSLEFAILDVDGNALDIDGRSYIVCSIQE